MFCFLLSFGWSPGVWILCADVSKHFVPSQIGRVKKKKNWDEIARVFLQVKVWLKRNLGQSGGGTGRGRVRIEEQAVKGNGPKWRPLVRQGRKGETAPCRSDDEEPWDGSALSCFRRLSPFFKTVHKGFQRFA